MNKGPATRDRSHNFQVSVSLKQPIHRKRGNDQQQWKLRRNELLHGLVNGS